MPRRKGPAAYLKSQAKRAGRQMMPHRVLWRVFGPGTPPPSKKQIKRKLAARTVATGSREDYVRMLTKVERGMRPRPAAKGGGKPAGKGRGDVYAAARQVPARNQAAAKKSAAAAKTAAGKKQNYRQNKDGKMNGSVTLPGADLTHYNAAKNGNAVIQPGEPNRRRI